MNTSARKKAHDNLSDQQHKNIAFFSTRSYEHALFSELLETLNGASDKPINATFFQPQRVAVDTAMLLCL